MSKVLFFWLLIAATLGLFGLGVLCPGGSCGLPSLDRIGLEFFHQLHAPMLDRFMLAITWFGSLNLLLPLAIMLAWSFYKQGHCRRSAFLLLALLGSTALGHLVKIAATRPRPDPFTALTPMPEDWSFPSSHAMQATALALALFLLARRRRLLLGFLLAGIVVLVGASRIYLQVHFPSDVIAGTLAAAFWVAGLYYLTWAKPTHVRISGNGDNSE